MNIIFSPQTYFCSKSNKDEQFLRELKVKIEALAKENNISFEEAKKLYIRTLNNIVNPIQRNKEGYVIPKNPDDIKYN